MRGGRTYPRLVMAALEAAIQPFAQLLGGTGWMAGSKPGHDELGKANSHQGEDTGSN